MSSASAKAFCVASLLFWLSPCTSEDFQTLRMRHLDGMCCHVLDDHGAATGAGQLETHILSQTPEQAYILLKAVVDCLTTKRSVTG